MEENPTDEKSLDKLRYKALSHNLMAELSLEDSPVAVKFFYTEAEFEFFKKGNEYHLTTAPKTFCQCVRDARTKAQTIYVELKELQCDSDAHGFEWKGSTQTASSSKQYLSKCVFAIALAPLAVARFIADTVNVSCNTTQADTLVSAWREVSGVSAWRPEAAEDLSSCGCTVFVHNKNIATVGSVCPSSCDERESDQMDVILPADHLKHTVDQLSAGKLSLNSSPFSRAGDGVFRYVLHE